MNVKPKFRPKEKFALRIFCFFKRPQQKCGLKKKASLKKKKCGRHVGAKIKAPTSKMWACQKKKKWAKPTFSNIHFWAPAILIYLLTTQPTISAEKTNFPGNPFLLYFLPWNHIIQLNIVSSGCFIDQKSI